MKRILVLVSPYTVEGAGIRLQVIKTAALLGLILLGIGTIFFLQRSAFLSPSIGILVLKVGSVFVGALVAGLAGFAFSAVSGAILLHWLPAITIVPLLLACSITTQLLSITKLWRAMQWRQCAPFLLGGMFGIPVGVSLLQDLNVHAFAVVIGGFLVCYGAYMLLSPKIVIPRGNRLIDVAVGFAGGVTGRIIAFPGAVPTILCSIRGLAKHEQRGIVQPFILLMQIATLIYLAKLDIVVSGITVTYLWCLPAVLGGTWIGLHLFHRIDDAMFRRFVLIFLVVSGAILIM